MESLLSHEEKLESFVLVDVEMLSRVFFPNPATCLIDLIPTPLLKTFHGFFEVELLNTANYFPQTSVFSAALQMAAVRPLLRSNSEKIPND